MRFKRLMWFVGFLLVIKSVSVSFAGTEPVFSVDELQEDWRYVQKTLFATHPDVYASADREALADAFSRIGAQLNKPMTQDEAWRVLAGANPVFADTHITVVSPDSIGQTTRWLASGGGLFPFEVHVEPSGQVFVVSALGGDASEWQRAQIVAINGQPAEAIVAQLLARTNGDTLAFRAGNLSRRWWWFYWKTFGSPAQFDVQLKRQEKVTTLKLAASRQTPEWILDDGGEHFARAFQFDVHNGVGVLTLNTFYWPDKAAFLTFTQQAFATLKEKNTHTLIIDIRKNGGGDDDLWKDGVMPYLASKPYRHGSNYQLKIIEGRQREGQKVGDVINGAIETWGQPNADEAARFNGAVYVVIGRSTYSSAVLFANTMQDFGFAKLVGTGGFARARQTGGIQKFTLPHSKLNIIVPRFVLDRPSGKREPLWLMPDIELSDDPFAPEQLLTQLQQVVRASSQNESTHKSLGAQTSAQ